MARIRWEKTGILWKITGIQWNESETKWVEPDDKNLKKLEYDGTHLRKKGEMWWKKSGELGNDGRIWRKVTGMIDNLL